MNIKKINRFLVEKLFSPKLENTFGYIPMTKSTSFTVYKRKMGGKRIEAAYGNVVVVSVNRRKKLHIYPDVRYPLLKYTILFNNKNFPGLINNSSLTYCLVIPYIRKISSNAVEKAWRVVVVTDKAQIYHNFPARNNDYDGKSLDKDITCFEESVVWDLPSKSYPSLSRECDESERFYPGLPDEAYEYHPGISIRSKFGNNGFSKNKKIENQVLPRFYVPQRLPEANPFYYMSGISSDYKMTVLGTYRSNVECGVRTCIFATDDGGRQWYCKYEFGDIGEYDFQQGFSKWGNNFGNKIKLEQKKNIGSVVLSKRECITPNCSNKDPNKKFAWNKDIIFETCDYEDTITLTTKGSHGLKTGNIVTVVSASGELKWMKNDKCSEYSAGNGMLFKVQCIDDNTIKLYEYVSSPDNPISCRHIHHINRVRDGWVIGTGEIYPNSWLLYMQMKEADTYSEKHAYDKFDIYRLNSSENSVQRTLGFLWFDDNTVLYASDHDVLESKIKTQLFEDRDISFSRNVTGVYRGKMRDIDNHNAFKVVYESIEPAYLFKKVENAIVFSGQRGELALSFDSGDTWECAHIDGPLNHPKGSTYNWSIYDDYLLKTNVGIIKH